MTKQMKSSLAAALLACVASLPAFAADISVTSVWTRATMPAQKVGGAFMQIESDADARLVAASSPVAGRTELHAMKVDEANVMRMREVEAIELPKGKTVSLAPGGLHIMLINLKQPLVAGEAVPITLVVESGGKRQTVEVKADVRAIGGSMSHQPHQSR